MTSSKECFLSHLTPQGVTRLHSGGGKGVPKRYEAHFTMLLALGIITMIGWCTDLGALPLTVGYFAVAKSAGVARAIFNGRSFSSCFVAPPSVNLCPLPGFP